MPETRDLPILTVPPAPERDGPPPPEAESLHLRAARPTVAIVADKALREKLSGILAPRQGLEVKGEAALGEAAVILAEVRPPVREAIARIRAAARSDALLLAVQADASPNHVAAAHASGAFATLRFPLLGEQVLGLVDSALDSHQARRRGDERGDTFTMEEHLASIHRIGAGAHHALAAPLAAALENLQRATDASPPESIRPPLEAAWGDLDRMSKMLARLAELGNAAEAELTRVDLRHTLSVVRKLARFELDAVQVEEVVQGGGVALGDSALVTQVLLHLTTNAARAATSLPSPRVRFHAYDAGGEVIVSVRDNGPGIEPDLHDKVFEPFFTTRRNEGAAGLGLSLSRVYALRMRARLGLWSMPGRGACVRLGLRRP
ncbi:MAG TPA: ATP-binding protein [Polyangiaceae bacterium]|jgi:signal transduction histidine kinase